MFDHLLNQSASIYTPVTSSSAIKEVKTTWTLASSSVPCRIRPLTGRELYMSQAKGVLATSKCYMPIGTNINENDEIEVAGTRYQVTWVSRDSELHHLEVELLERRPKR